MTVQIIKTAMPKLTWKSTRDARFIIRNGSAILREGKSNNFDLLDLEEMFKVLFKEDVTYVDKHKPEYKISYRCLIFRMLENFV